MLRTSILPALKLEKKFFKWAYINYILLKYGNKEDSVEKEEENSDTEEYESSESEGKTEKNDKDI